MRDFHLPFKPEELLAKPADGRLWASDLPPVDEWSADEDGAAKVGAALDAMIGRLMKSSGLDLAQDESFCLLFALLQAWPRVEDSVKPRVVDLLTDAARKVAAEAKRLKAKPATSKGKDLQKEQTAAQAARIAAKVAVFFMRWAAERVLKQSTEAVWGKGRGRGRKADPKDADAAAVEAEAKEAQKALERNRCTVLAELANMISKGAMPWLWVAEPAAWQQIAQAISDGGFYALDNADCLKHRETRQMALRCVAEPLLQEGHQHSNLLVATTSKLMHGLRGGEGGAPFAADALLMAHNTSLPRSFLVELTQRCTGAELTSQGQFQRSLAAFLVAVAERLPHVVLANISVLLPLLDVDCYPLRCAIVESIGQLLVQEGRKLPSGACCNPGAGAAQADEGEGEEGAEPAAKQADVVVDCFSMAAATKADLLETLLSRSLDKSVWVRYRVLQTLTGLASNTKVAALPREQWARVLEIATKRMQDAASMARKSAMQLVRTLIEFHPYGPALGGSGDERAKAQQLLKEIAGRIQKLLDEETEELDHACEVADAAMAAVAEGDEAEGEGEGEGPSKRRRLGKKTVTDQTIAVEVQKALESVEGGERKEERERQRDALHRMRDCYTQRVQFVELIDAAETRLRALLVSRTPTDVTEAIGVVVELKLRGVPAAASAFNQVLGLVWSRHLPIKDAAVDAFYRMFLQGRSTAASTRVLLEMYEAGCKGSGWTYTHLASVEELIKECTEKELIKPKEAIPELVAALRSGACSMALRTLTALGAASVADLAAQLGGMVEILGPGGPRVGRDGAEQLERCLLLCKLLQRLLGAAGPKAPLDEAAMGHLHALSQHAICVVVANFSHGQIAPQWYAAAQAAMDLSFDLGMMCTPKDTSVARCPDKLWELILSRMLTGVLGRAAPAGYGASGAEADGEGVTDVVQAAKGEVSSAQIGCIIFLAGHLALRMVIYLEGLQSALKKKRQAEEDQRMESARDAKKEKAAAAEKAQKGKKGKKGAPKEEEGDGDEASSMGMAGLEERENEAFADLVENGLLYGSRSFLDRVKPLLFSCLLEPNMRVDPTLRRLGAISLCKFMTVSKRFCQENLQLLFSILFPKAGPSSLSFDGSAEAESAAQDVAAGKGALFEDLTLRQSLLVAVGDLLFRHPNVVEPWSGRLYATLGVGGSQASEDEAAAELRLTALLVLTHLVLNDMMKPRAVLLVQALWLTACKHESTARVARIMFQELSKRSTPVVYNLLPEIIARLPEHQGASQQITGLPEERVQYLMQFIEKEKQVEGLIEKLSVRLEQAANIAGGHAVAAAKEDLPLVAKAPAEEEDVAGAQDGAEPPSKGLATATVSCLAHAIGSMHYTDRCIVRLHDVIVVRKGINTAISFFPVVRECLMQIVEKAKKPKGGKGAADAGLQPAETEAPAAGGDAAAAPAKGGLSASAVAAIDAIEQAINGLAKGAGTCLEAKEGVPVEDAAVPIANVEEAAPAEKPAAKGKRKAQEADEDDEEELLAPKKAGKGKGRGRGRGGKENAKENSGGNAIREALNSKAPRLGRGAGRRAVRANVDDDEE